MWTIEQAKAISEQTAKLRAIADRIQAMKYRRAIAAYCRALGSEPKADSTLNMCVIHNSLVSRENGKPWREVDYSQMRLAARLTSDWRASRLCDAFYARKWQEVRNSQG